MGKSQTNIPEVGNKQYEKSNKFSRTDRVLYATLNAPWGAVFAASLVRHFARFISVYWAFMGC